MKSKYSIRLYELLKSYSNLPHWWFDIDVLKKKLNCENYNRYPDFKRYVLDIAVKEINRFTELDIYYEPFKEYSRSYNRIQFYIDEKAVFDKLEANRQVNDFFEDGDKPLELPGQLGLDGQEVPGDTRQLELSGHEVNLQ